MNKQKFKEIEAEVKKDPKILQSLPPFYRLIAEKIWLNTSEESESSKQ